MSKETLSKEQSVSSVEECWSADEEYFNYTTLDELLDSHDDLEVGSVVYVGESVIPDPADWVAGDDVVENLACRAFDDCGEVAEDYPDVSQEARIELQIFLEGWARKHATPAFWKVKNVRPYTIIAEDLS